MKRLIFILVATMLSVQLNAQTLGTVSGTVKDKNTQEELIGVAIQFFGSDTLGVVTDENGSFSIKIPVGKYNLKASTLDMKYLNNTI